VPDAFADVFAAGDQDVLLYRGHQYETDRTDHPDLRVEIGVHQNGAESTRYQQETYQGTTDYRQDHAAESFHRAFAKSQRPCTDWLQEPPVQLDGVSPTIHRERSRLRMIEHDDDQIAKMHANE